METNLDLVGKMFGLLTVIEQLGTKWRCKCYCGKEIALCLWELRLKDEKHSGTCGCGCYKKGNTSPLWKGHGEISSRFWHNIKNNSKARGHKFEITIEEAWNIFTLQEKRCPLSGEELTFATQTYTLGSASLDRIDSTKGYTIDNIQWVHKTINSMKWDLSRDRFIELCRLVVSPLEPINCVPTVFPKPHKNWRGAGGLPMGFWDRYIQGSKKRGLDFDLSIQDGWNLFCTQQGCCAITGLPMEIGQHREGHSSASLDRIDNSKGYTIDNVQWVHTEINVKLRRHLSLPEMREWAAKVVAIAGP